MPIIKIITCMITQLVSNRAMILASAPEPLPGIIFFYHYMLWETAIPSGIHNKLIIGHIVQQQRETCSQFFFELHIFWGKIENFRYHYRDLFSFFLHSQQLVSVEHQIWEVKLKKLEENLLEKASSAFKKNAKFANSRALDSLITLNRGKPIKHFKLLFWGSPKQHKSKEEIFNY